MADKELTKAEKLKRELATALKEEILEKIKPNILFRSKSNRKFFHLQTNQDNEPYITMLNTGNVYDPDFSYKLSKLVEDQLEVKTITLFTGCWGMTDSPVNKVRESSLGELQKYFDKIAEKMCQTVRTAMDHAYVSVAVEMGLLPDTPEDSEWDK